MNKMKQWEWETGEFYMTVGSEWSATSEYENYQATDNSALIFLEGTVHPKMRKKSVTCFQSLWPLTLRSSIEAFFCNSPITPWSLINLCSERATHSMTKQYSTLLAIHINCWMLAVEISRLGWKTCVACIGMSNMSLWSVRTAPDWQIVP